ncbi:MAG: 4-alpha-glucanotransferase [Planctomycetota bacterium]
MNAIPQPLRDLCALCGVCTEYYSIDGTLHVAEPGILRRVLTCLGVAVGETDDDARRAFDDMQQAQLSRVLPPVIVAEAGRPADLTLTLPRGASGQLDLTVSDEAGAQRLAVAYDIEDDLHVHGQPEIGEQRHWRCRVTLPDALPAGYWGVTVRTSGAGECSAKLIVAPPRAWQPDGGARRQWGVFVPLYALHSAHSQAVGDVSDLDRLREWVKSLGGNVVATLPLLASFNSPSGPFEPSPYTPASRLFWNELYLDLHALPELATSPAAQARLQSDEFAQAVAAQSRSRHVDHAAVMKLKREVIERVLADMPDDARAAVHREAEAIPHMRAYARFRAQCEVRNESWHLWPTVPQISPRDPDADPRVFAAKRYHTFVQVSMRRQMRALAEKSRASGTALYVDQPLGIHPDSFDLYRWRDRFVPGLSCGAPPDPLATAGQDWGIPPLHPMKNREAGYDYVIDSLRHVMDVAGILRIDHIMQLHRIFTIPSGEKGDKGVYLNYPHDELWAIIRLESHRRKCEVIGEDLGTVPDEVRNAMAANGVSGMSVMQFEIWNDADRALRPPPATKVASVNTHDTPTWAGFWHGRDIDDRVVLGWQTPEGAAHEKQQREWSLGALAEFLRRNGRMQGDGTPACVLRGCFEYLALSPSPLVMVTLEDLWLEAEPQNVPGTWRERPNWQRRCAHSLEALRGMDASVAMLRALSASRPGV